MRTAIRILLWLVLLAVLVVVSPPPEGISWAEDPGYMAGRLLGSIAIGALIWFFIGRRGGQEADMTSPWIMGIALAIAMLPRATESAAVVLEKFPNLLWWT